MYIILLSKYTIPSIATVMFQLLLKIQQKLKKTQLAPTEEQTKKDRMVKSFGS